MKKVMSTSVVFASLFISACSTSSPTPSPTTVYHPVGSVGAGTVNFAGKGIKITHPSPNQLSIVDGTGSQNRTTRAITVATDGYSTFDADGADTNDQVQGGNGDLATLRMDEFTGNYDYVMPAIYEPSSNLNVQYHGFLGVETVASDMPSAGTASYVGEALLNIDDTSGNLGTDYYLSNGVAQLDVDFSGTGSANLTMNGFTATAGFNNVVVAPFDTYKVDGMAINGSEFSGGSTTLLSGGSVVTPLGTITSDQTEGMFYAYDSTVNGPDEAAGVVLLQGADAQVFGGFIVD
ncbi:transferrin-binding protein-like solute binding protein [Rhodobacteraceae bacterium]|nr:transferrin-binding protein-like solute binding protein [Paracoccaceae bacterium]